MLSHLALENILFIDIETAAVTYRFQDLDEKAQELWSLKTRWIQQREGLSPEEVYERAGIHAEFSQVICATVGHFAEMDGEQVLRIKSFAHREEEKVLRGLSEVFGRFFRNNKGLLCAHNGKEFDFPFLARRYVIQSVPLPPVLDLAGKKPWEVQHLDTMDLWKFGDYKHYTSVDLLAYALGIESPKDDIKGADVGRVFHEENDLRRIQAYCEKDVITIARILQRFKGRGPIGEEHIVKA